VVEPVAGLQQPQLVLVISIPKVGDALQQKLGVTDVAGGVTSAVEVF